MFREGHYLEMVKASEDCVATAIITIKEKTVEYKNKKVTTNKWLDLHDWASLYGIMRKAILRYYENQSRKNMYTTERRKSIGHLDIKYKFDKEASSKSEDLFPTIRVFVSSARRASTRSDARKIKETKDIVKNKREKEKVKNEVGRSDSSLQYCVENYSFSLENNSFEEYVPPQVPSTGNVNANLDYVPSRKSALLKMRSLGETNGYTPISRTSIDDPFDDNRTKINYVPNSIKSLPKVLHESYDPCEKSSLSTLLGAAYVPSSKSVLKIEEYQPNFASETMKFDDSYVPSATYAKAEAKESRKQLSRKRKDSTTSKKMASSSHTLISKIAKREF